MNRDKLIQRLVDRKMESSKNDSVTPFCICMARKLCFAGARQPNMPKQK